MKLHKSLNLVKPKTRYVALLAALALAVVLAVFFTFESIAADDMLSLSYKAASSPTLKSGEQLVYTIHLINNSVTEANANVSDKIPVELTYIAGSVSHNGAFNSASNLITWDNVKVPGSGEVVLSFKVTPAIQVEESVDVINKASIQIVGEDGMGQILTRAVLISILPGEVVEPPVLNAFKTASQSQIMPGELLTYSIQVTNSGIQDAMVNVSDPLPRVMNYVDGSVSGNGVYDPNARTIDWENVTVPAASEVVLTFQAMPAVEEVSEPIEAINVATVTGEGQVINAEVKVTIVSKQLSPDSVQPVVNKVTIADRDVVADPKVTINVDASDDAAWMFVREYTVRTVYNQPVWELVNSSEWAPFQASFEWELAPYSGVHYILVMVVDENNSRSLLNENSMDFISLNQPNTSTDKPGLIPYQVYYQAGVDVNIQLSPSVGNADLYVWYPNNFEMPNHSSILPATALDQASFTTPEAGVYIILIHAVEPTTYNLVINPAGGPNGYATAGVNNNAPETPSEGVFSMEPVFSVIGVNPLGVVEPVDGPYFVRMPFIIK